MGEGECPGTIVRGEGECPPAGSTVFQQARPGLFHDAFSHLRPAPSYARRILAAASRRVFFQQLRRQMKWKIRRQRV